MPLRIAKRKPLKGEKLVIIAEETGRLTCGDASVRLPPQMLKMFVHLADRSPRIVTREQILILTRPPANKDEEVDVNIVKTLVSNLRGRLNYLTDLEVVETVRGVGYRIPNYVEVHTNVNEGETLRIPGDVFGMLVNLAFELGQPFDKVVRDVLVEGGRVLQKRVLSEMAKDPDPPESFVEDPWS